MAIKYKEEALPDIAKLDFDVYRWGGLNKIKAAQSDGDMAECKNMSSDNFPYASPRKPRELIKSESGIKRICKIEDGKIFYIDSAGKYCMLSEIEGVWTKTELSTKDINGTPSSIVVNQLKCSANYDSSTLFFPDMSYTIPDTINQTPNAGGNFRLVERHMKMTKYLGGIDEENHHYGEQKGYFRYIDELSDGNNYYYYLTLNNAKSVYIESDNVYIECPEARTFKIAFELPKASSYAYLYYNINTVYNENTTQIEEVDNAYISYDRNNHITYLRALQIRFFDKNGNIMTYQTTDEGNHPYTTECVEVPLTAISRRREEYTVTVPQSIKLEKGDYFTVTAGWFFDTGTSPSTTKNFKDEINYLSTAQWYITKADASGNNIAVLPLNYAVIYNNRVVGVNKSDIRASALGDFSNYWEYADEAGNPSATGAYATDVGSYGDFTGIAPYNNVLLLFKKDIVYEMYGSMPYTITELCKTGCIDNDSIVSVNGVMYWASPYGFVRYAGGMPAVISHGTDIKTDGAFKSSTDGRKIYCYDGDRIYVYDTLYQMWHIEDSSEVKMFFGNINDVYSVLSDGIYRLNSGTERIEWEFVTKDYTFNIKERKNLSKIWIRSEMSENSALEIYVRQDGGEWKRVAVKTAEKQEMFDFKLRVKKFDSFTIKFKGRGDVKILDIHGNVTVGTSKHRSGASLNIYRR